MYVKIHETQGKRIVAACDDALIGTVIREGKRVLDLKTYQAFYEGERIAEQELCQALQEFSSANLVGMETTRVAIRTGLARKGDLMYIARVPYLHIYRM